MSKKEITGSGDHPLRETEDVAYNAFREWPVLMALREKELQALQANPEEEHLPETRPATASNVGNPD